MRSSLSVAALLAGLIATAGIPAPVSAYHRLKFGPIEVVPSLSVEVRQHSNVYVASDKQAAANRNAEVSGFLFDIRPGLNVSIKPNLEKVIRGLYLDLRYSPTLALFPSAPKLTCEQRGIPSPCPNVDDTLKIDHHFFSGIRYQTSPRLTFSAGLDYTQPELSQSNLRLNDISARGGAKLDLSKRISTEGVVSWKRFQTPVDLTPPGSAALITQDSPFGSFDAPSYEARVGFQWRPTLNLAASYRRTTREFVGVPLKPLCPPGASPADCPTDPNDLQPSDGIPDNRKDYRQQEYSGTVQKRLSRTSRGTASFGRVVRSNEARQFGAKEYTSWTAAASVETLLSKRTQLQASAERTLADTVREITFADVNAFTQDQTGQFAVLPEQFSTAQDLRFVVDLIQNVRRGDQILLGIAWQRDRLLDQIGSTNRFLPPDASGDTGRTLDAAECEAVSASGTGYFCRTVLDNQIDRKFLFTAGYRLRLRRWLGVQARGGYFRGRSTPEFTAALTEARPDLPARPPDQTSYWSFSGGMVLNLQVFHQ